MALALVLVVLTCGVPGLLLAGVLGGGAGRTAGRADDPATAAARRLGVRMTGQLDRQAAALLGGDRAGFLAVADPAARADLTRRYAEEASDHAFGEQWSTLHGDCVGYVRAVAG
ncbi:hypothetical protein [Micromonospora coerulea]|uniref:hypothetical protein n=1 Tax=Micromonospora coerulea TaxID=47856 RepID=UPI001904F39B|nr:hypothetical protein [Micromonospora veneta]